MTDFTIIGSGAGGSSVALELLENNQALLALDDDDAWESLDFLAFDDSLAEKARRETARSHNSCSAFSATPMARIQ